MNNLLLAVWLSFLTIYPLNAVALSLAEQRLAFLQAENLVQKRDEAGFVAQMQTLKDYPLYPYLQAHWLKNDLTKEAEIAAFLTAYKDNRYADGLRRDWLTALAKANQWSKFIQYYQVDSESSKVPALQCAFQSLQYGLGKKEQALAVAKELWQSLKSQPVECNALFTILRGSPSFTEELLWQRFSASLRGKKANPALAAALQTFMVSNELPTAQLWLKVHANPNLVAQENWAGNTPKAGELFAHAIDRLAAKQLSAAITLWDGQKNRYKINNLTTDYIEQRLGLALVAAGNPAEAFARLMKATTLETEGRQNLLRMALKEQNWQHVTQALEKLTPAEKADDKGRYWQARALAELGKPTEAQALYSELAKKSNFYGFLAADKLKQAYQFKDLPVPVSTSDIDTLKQQDDFKVVAEWFALGRETEATRHWWYAIKKLDSKQIMAAAKLAQQWQQYKLAAFTIAKADYWVDLELRFPLLYVAQITEQTTKQNVDPALILGLIRQESVFDERAGSSVGAMGLMQIMPSTGKHIANSLNERWTGAASLYDPSVNVRYGTYYYKQLLDKFNGQVPLATAGYNAGPNRIKNWRPDKPMPMDIWIETIPFNETRQYVSFVLSNALFYQQRTNRNVLKLEDFMSEVQPD